MPRNDADVALAPSWGQSLDALAHDLNRRSEWLDSIHSTDGVPAYGADEPTAVAALTVMTFPTHAARPNRVERARAESLRETLTEQEHRIQILLSNLNGEIHRVTRLQTQDSSRTVTEINSGGFEAHA